MKKKVKIIKQATKGGIDGNQRGYALYRSGRIDDFRPSNEQSYRDTLPEAPEEIANVNAEKSEMVMADYAGDGIPQLMNVGGPSHAEGGKDIFVPDQGFIFSDTRDMKIKGEILSEFGKSKDTKKKYTPAKLAKQYDLNFYKDKLKQKNADKISNDSAALMLENNQNKLAKLALLQEANKGFPNGIPAMSQSLFPEQGKKEAPQVAKYGGLVKAKDGFNFDPPDKYGKHVKDSFSSINPLTGKKSREWNGMTDFTGSADYAEKVGYTGKIDLSSGAAIDRTNRAIQQFVKDNYPSVVKKYHSEDSYGMPYAKTEVDGKLGVRWQKIAEDINIPIQLPAKDKPNYIPDPMRYNQPQEDQIPVKEAVIDNKIPNDFRPGTPNFTNKQSDGITPAFWDKIGLLSAATRPIDHIRPQLFSPNVQITNPSFVDNRAEIQQLQSVAEANNDVIQNTSSGAVARANSMMNQGRLFDPINRSNQQMNNTNIGINNDFGRYKDQVLNTNAAQKVGALAQYTQMNDMYRANLSKEKRMKGADIMLQGQNLTNNMTGMMAMKARYPNYNFNWNTPIPSTSFVPGNPDITSGGGSNTGSSASSLAEQAKQLMSQNPGLDFTQAINLIKLSLGKTVTTYDRDSDIPDSRRVLTQP